MEKNMEKLKIKLYDYEETKQEFEIENIENVILAIYEVISGDENLTIFYNNNKVIRYDACDTYRLQNHYDEEIYLTKEQLTKINKLKGTNSYDRARQLEKIEKFTYKVIKNKYDGELEND